MVAQDMVLDLAVAGIDTPSALDLTCQTPPEHDASPAHIIGAFCLALHGLSPFSVL
jgi:hypothetical protein